MEWFISLPHELGEQTPYLFCEVLPLFESDEVFVPHFLQFYLQFISIGILFSGQTRCLAVPSGYQGSHLAAGAQFAGRAQGQAIYWIK